MGAHAGNVRQSPQQKEGAPYTYDAFISYTHHDRAVASGVQKGLHQIGRRLGRLNALRVFRDATDLTASPDLWGNVAAALDRSRYLIVVLSPDSTTSHWVDKEVGYWLEHRGPEQLMLVVTGGRLVWDETSGRFDPDHSDVALPVLTVPGALPAEPFYVDVTEDAPWDPRTPLFREKVTDLAAPIHGKPKYQLASDDVRELRRFHRWRNAAIIGLAVLTVLALTAAVIAVVQRQEAVRQRNQAIALLLVSQAQGMLAGARDGDDVRALQLILASARISAKTDESALLDALIDRRDTLKIIDTASAVLSASVRPDGHRIVSGGSDGKLQLWDADSGRLVGQPLTGHTDWVNSVAFSPDGRRVVSGSGDNTVRVWDADTGQSVGRPLTGHTESVNSVAFSPDGRRILSGGVDRTVRVWEADTGRPIGVSRTGHRGPVNSVAFSPDGQRIVSASGDKTVRVWDTDTGVVGGPSAGYQSAVASVAFSPEGQRVVSGGADRTVRVWDADTRQSIGQPFTGHTDIVDSVAFSPDGRYIVSGGADNTVRVWNADTGQPIGQPFTGHTDFVTSVAFSPDGRRIVSGSNDATIRVWDVDTGQPVGHPFTSGLNNSVWSVAFSPAGRHIVSGGIDKTVRIWNVETGLPVGTPLTGHYDAVTSVAVSADGQYIVSGSLDETLRVWDTRTLQSVGQPLTGHQNAVYGVAVSSDGRYVVSGGKDETVRLWDTRTSQPVGEPLTGHQNVVAAVAVSSDGRRIVSGGLDGVRLWPGPAAWADELCAKLTSNMSHQQWRDWVSPDISYEKVCPNLPDPPDNG